MTAWCRPASFRRLPASGSASRSRSSIPRSRRLPVDKIRYHVCWGSKLAWPAHQRRAAQGHRRSRLLGVEGRRLCHRRRPIRAMSTNGKCGSDAKLAPGQVLIPGVISHATNVVEHPELVAERIVRPPPGETRRPRQRHRRNRLRLCAGAVPPPRPPVHHVGLNYSRWPRVPALRPQELWSQTSQVYRRHSRRRTAGS